MMNSTPRSMNYSAARLIHEEQNLLAGVATPSRFAIHQIKRSILEKLWIRMNRVGCSFPSSETERGCLCPRQESE